ncbi:NAD(P)-dependent alcohol dehydrogenase [Phenylobacterium deserti]|uniref:NAD(P)-dependent alcohol dehydrogenase n=1 Tax=Phenylobacterium deserti TaxID=1914756 RepID=A0A328ASH6_9CAUL|nr:NAD(P)-dependent alcohol dehydrogenase [Phenylobacterium deserti]RAK57275.1 NAD(P)-dependent alcohol dehydrogenase [Phenylobacterium deserti]
MISALGYASKNAHSHLHRWEFERDDPKANEVVIDVLFCGVCHSDIHQVKNEWGNSVYPCLPGHEIVGRVSRIGAQVSRYKEGDLVGVGCMIDSCRQCDACRSGEQNYCQGPNSWLATYNGPMKPAKEAGQNMYGRDNTFGGYSNVVVVPEDFVLRIPEGLDPAAAAPILCAGVTTFSPMRHWEVKAGDKVGVVGLGGLGHMALKLAKALGAKVTVFTSTKEKIKEAKTLGADEAYLEDDEKALEPLEASFDFIISTIPQKHDVNPFIALLKHDRTLAIVGALEEMKGVNNMDTAMLRRSVAGSLIGSIDETQEVLDFCAQHQVAPEIEIIDIKDINDAMKKVEKGEVRFRYVIDMATLS